MKKLIVWFVAYSSFLSPNEIQHARRASNTYIKAIHAFCCCSENKVFVKLTCKAIKQELSQKQAREILAHKENNFIDLLISFLEETPLYKNNHKIIKKVEDTGNRYLNLIQELYEEALDNLQDKDEATIITNHTDDARHFLHQHYIKMPLLKTLEEKCKK